jgi:hypothetical protein
MKPRVPATRIGPGSLIIFTAAGMTAAVLIEYRSSSVVDGLNEHP